MEANTTQHANIGVIIRQLISVMTLDTLELRLKYHLATVAEYASISDHLQHTRAMAYQMYRLRQNPGIILRVCMNLFSEDIK